MDLTKTLVTLSLASLGCACFGQTAIQPPPNSAQLPVETGGWAPGTPDKMEPVYPVVREIENKPAAFKFPLVSVVQGRAPREPFTPDPRNNPVGTVDRSVMDSQPLLTGFAGIGQTNLTPPDTHCAAGPDYVMAVVNARLAVYDKCGTVLREQDASDFLNDTNFIFDPKVQYDPWNSRWVMLWHIRNSGTQQSWLALCLSQTSNPLGSWWVYKFPANTGTGGDLAWVDYYDLGYGQTGLYAAGNQFRYSNSTFTTATFRTWDKGQVYNGQGAVMRTDLNLTNPDNSTTFAPRASQMQVVFTGGGGFDQAFINSRNGGGDKLTLWKLADPLGAHTLTKVDIDVNNYILAPDAVQPGGQQLDTLDCRLLNSVVSSIGNPGATLFTSLTSGFDWTGDPTRRAVTALFTIDPLANSVRTQHFFGQAGAYYWMASAAADYDVNGIWVFSRTRPDGTFGEMRYVDWVEGTFSSASSLAKAGTTNYSPTNERWGDYLGAQVDWADFTGGSPPMKMWFYAQYCGHASNWVTWLACTAVNVTEGTMTVTPGTGFTTTGLVGGPFSPSSTNYTVGNTGDVSYAFEILNLPSWLDASYTSNEVRGGGSRNVTISTNAATNSLAYGIHSATITFRNCFNGQTFNRLMRAIVEVILPVRSFSLDRGLVLSGNLASLNASDDDRLVMRPGIVFSTTEAPIQLVVNTVAPSASASQIIFSVEASVNQGNIGQTILMFNWQTNAYEQMRVDAGTTSDSIKTVTVTSNANRFINQSDRSMRSKISYKTTGPVFSYPWQGRVDHVFWRLTP